MITTELMKIWKLGSTFRIQLTEEVDAYMSGKIEIQILIIGEKNVALNLCTKILFNYESNQLLVYFQKYNI